MLYKKDWYFGINNYYKTGSIHHVKTPLHWWLLDRLLMLHPHWGWWDDMWARIFPNWGDPLCAAYCLMWSDFYFEHEIRIFSTKVDWNLIPDEYKDDYDYMEDIQ